MTRPTDQVTWDTNTTHSADPGATKKANGYSLNETFPSNEFNWLQGAQGDWIEFLKRAVLAFASVAEGIADVIAGDVFMVSKSNPSLISESIHTDARTGGVATRVIDTDGVYYAFVPWENDDILLGLLDGTAPTTITPSATDTVTSLGLDGARLWSVTDNDDLFCHDYAGTQLGTAAIGSVGAIHDVGYEHALVVRDSGRYIDIFDGLGALIDTLDLGAAGVVDFVRWSPRPPGSSARYFIVAWQDSGTAKVNQYVHTSGAPTSLWTFTTGLGDPVAMWVTQSRLQMVLDAVGTISLVTYLAPYAAIDTAPVAASRVTMTGSAWANWSASPSYIIGWDPAGTTIQAWTWAGRDLGIFDIPTNPHKIQGMACDGLDMVIVAGETTDDVVHWIHLGDSAPTLRRYADTDWKPLCHSLAVATQGGA